MGIKKENVSSIRVSYQTKERLMGIGERGDTFDQTINELVDFWIDNSQNS